MALAPQHDFRHRLDRMAWECGLYTYTGGVVRSMYVFLSPPLVVLRNGSDSSLLLATKIITAANIALPACCLSICVDLKQSFLSPKARPLPRTARSRWLIQALLCLVLPIVYAILGKPMHNRGSQDMILITWFDSHYPAG
jgi:hypothetical protein